MKLCLIDIHVRWHLPRNLVELGSEKRAFLGDDGEYRVREQPQTSNAVVNYTYVNPEPRDDAHGFKRFEQAIESLSNAFKNIVVF